MEERPTVCVDLNGVLDLYSGWKGEEHWDEPRSGAREFLEKLSELGYRVVVLSTKNPSGIGAWLEKNELRHLVDEITNRKISAVAYIDDRAIRFNGDFGDALSALEEKPHWQGAKQAKEQKRDEQFWKGVL